MENSSPSIAEIVLDLPLDKSFDYFIPEGMRERVAPGSRVKIIFNRKRRIGFVVNLKFRSAFAKLNPILDAPDAGPVFNKPTINFLKEFAAHCGCSLGEAASTFLPEALRSGNSFLDQKPPDNTHSANAEFSAALLQAANFKDKWKHLFQEIQAVVAQKKGVIILVPEAAFLNAWENKFKESFQGKEMLFLWGKKQTHKQQLDLWRSIYATEAAVVIGTRSAVFSPVQNLGLIMVTEEQSPHYKQEQSPHYHAGVTAEIRARLSNSRLLLESSAPRAVTWQEAHKKKWEIIQSIEKPEGRVHIVDMANYNPMRSSPISFPLQNAIQTTLDKGGKVLLYLNQIGFTTITRCNQCGFTVICERCNSALVYSYAKRKMICRRCNQESDLPKICPKCNGNYMRSTGSGLEKIESEAARMYPGATTARFEKDSARFPHNAQIVVATQAVIKHLDAVGPDLIGLLKFDAHFNRPDYRGSEEAFYLLTKFRQAARSSLFVQTYMPDHYCFKAIGKGKAADFYKQELKFRKEANLPPYVSIVQIFLRGKNEDQVIKESQRFYDKLLEKKPKAIDIVEPHPDVVAKIRDNFRFAIEVKGKSVKNILSFIKKALKGFKRPYGVIVTLDVDA